MVPVDPLSESYSRKETFGVKIRSCVTNPNAPNRIPTVLNINLVTVNIPQTITKLF